jgi:hypothetical protein
MPRHVELTVPPEHAPAVHEALLSVYGRAAGALADAAGGNDTERLRDARRALLDADDALTGFEGGELAGPALLVHFVLGAALEDAAGTFALRLGEYGRGEVALDGVAGALDALGGLFSLFAQVARSESV